MNTNNSTPSMSAELLHRRTIPLEGFISCFDIEHRPERSGTNVLGYSFHYAPNWKFHIRLTQSGYDPKGAFGHYALHLVCSDHDEVRAIQLRLTELQKTKRMLRLDAPMSFVNWKNGQAGRFACGEVLGLPLGVLYQDNALPSGSITTSRNGMERLRVDLRGMVKLFSVEPRERRGQFTLTGRLRTPHLDGWKLHILIVEEECSPTGALGRHGLHFYTDDRAELNYVQQALSWMQEEGIIFTLSAHVDYYEWRDRSTGAFRCGTTLSFPAEAFDICPF